MVSNRCTWNEDSENVYQLQRYHAVNDMTCAYIHEISDIVDVLWGYVQDQDVLNVILYRMVSYVLRRRRLPRVGNAHDGVVNFKNGLNSLKFCVRAITSVVENLSDSLSHSDDVLRMEVPPMTHVLVILEHVFADRLTCERFPHNSTAIMDECWNSYSQEAIILQMNLVIENDGIANKYISDMIRNSETIVDSLRNDKVAHNLSNGVGMLIDRHTAVFMALHARLGINSLMHCISVDVVLKIVGTAQWIG